LNKLFESALGISSPWYIDGVDFDVEHKRLNIHVNFERGATFIDSVDQVAYTAYDTVNKSWRHLNFFEHECLLSARVPRIKSADGSVTLVTPPWSGVVSGFTLLFEALLIQLCKAMPIHNVSQLTGVSDYLIWRVLDSYIAAAKLNDDFSAVEIIGMDETSIRKGHNYITLFVDLEEKKTLHISEGKDNTTVVEFAEVLEKKNGCRKNITDVSCDMSPAFIKGVKEQLPNAQVTFDKFHIMKIINEGVDNVRREEAKTNPLLKGARYAVLKNNANLTAKQKDVKAVLLEDLNMSTVIAMLMRETFQQLYLVDSLKEFEQGLKKWCTWIEDSKLPAMIKVKKTIEAHWGGIIRWQESRINNGILEGLNSVLQAAKRKARGYKVDHFKTIAYLITGKLDFSKVNNYCLPT
jgi:transposase